MHNHLKREDLARALHETAGSLRGDYPEWETPERVSEWVAESRRRDDERLDRKLASVQGCDVTDA